jgi:hypothetical protein
MIMAGLQKALFVEPTIIRLALSQRGEQFLLKREQVEGPLSYYLKSLKSAPQEIECQGFDLLTDAFSRAARTFDRSERAQLLAQTGKSLWDATKGLLSWLTDVLLHAEVCCVPEAIANLHPVHVHIMCGADMMALPLDLAFPSESENYLGRVMPVVWRISCPPGTMGLQPEPGYQANPTCYASMSMFWSCESLVKLDGINFNSLPNARQEVGSIHKDLALGVNEPARVLSKDELLQAILPGLGKKGRMLHIATHGVQTFPADGAGLIVGPHAGDEGQKVTAHDLAYFQQNSRPSAPAHRGEPFGFVYANCCELVQQAKGEESARSHHGSFAAALLQKGVCREAVSNRWSVTDERARLIAEKFYRTRPHTLHGRAVALLRACKETNDAMGGTASGDPTWLAPAHIWRES